MCTFDKINISLLCWTMKSEIKSKHSCFVDFQTTIRIMYHTATWHVTLKNDCTSWCHINGSVWERCNSIANAMELHLSCTNPSISCGIFTGKCVVWDDELLQDKSTYCFACREVMYYIMMMPYAATVHGDHNSLASKGCGSNFDV